MDTTNDEGKHDEAIIRADAQESEEEGKSDIEYESEEERIRDVEVGPIWNNTHAQRRAREYEQETGMTWTGNWKTTIPGRMSVIEISNRRPDTRPLQRAIENGDGDEVKAVLGAMNEKQVERQLRATYGGAPTKSKSPDDRDLFARTSHVLHAARRGDVSVFLEILRVMRRTLAPKVEKSLMKATDEVGRNLLAMVALSGRQIAFDTVLRELHTNLEPNEVKKMMKSPDKRNRSLIALGAENGSLPFVKHVLQRMLESISGQADKDIRNILGAMDGSGRSLLAMAVKSENREAFQFVLEFVQQTIPSEEMETLLTSRDSNGRSLIALAAEGRSQLFFNDALVTLRMFLEPAKGSEIITKGVVTGSLLVMAAGNGREAFLAVLDSLQSSTLSSSEVQAMMRSKDTSGRSLLMAAVESGNNETFSVVLTAVADMLPQEQANTMIKTTGGGKNSLLATAVKAGSKELFLAVKKTLETVMTEIELYELIAPDAFLDCDLLLTALRIDSATEGAEPLGLLKNSLAFVGDYLYSEKVANEQNRGGVDGQRLLCWAIRFFEIELFSITPVVVEHNLVDKKAAKTLKGIFSGWANDDDVQKRYKNNYDREMIKSKVVNDDSTELLREFLNRLAIKGRLLEWVRTCLAGPLVSSKNPFVSGMILSVEFARAADVAPEGERRNLSSLHNCVNDFLLEVLERLPQTVVGFKGGMRGCENMLLPKQNEKQSPLDLMIKKREQRQIYCMAPLVMDFLTRRFSRGLPDFRDDGEILGDKEELTSLTSFILGTPGDYDEDKFVTSSSVLLGKGNLLKHMSSGVAFLQGGFAGLPGLAGIPYFGGFPGLQFIVAGLLDKPSSYYQVPAMRMAMHFVAYVVMLVLFNKWVLLYNDETLTWEEIFFFVAFVAAGALREGYEMARDLDAYFTDGWNILDLSGLTVLLGAFIVRCVDSDNPWGHALYALSAPLICSRVLFFAQILRFQGPMIQVIFSMMGKLVQFGVIMVVVVLGFVMAFHALFMDVYTESETWRNLFKAMLGEVELFDELEDDTRDSVATALLVVYLLVITVVLLNLLIAVLSTSHSKVEENAEQEFRDAKIRIFQFYETAVEKQLFPAPFNLLQLLFTLPYKVVDFILPNSDRARSIHADEFYGQLVFRFVLCPVAFAVGVLLWFVSSLRAPFAWYMHYSNHSVIIAQGEGNGENEDHRGNQGEEVNTEKLTHGLVLLRCITIFLWCIFVAPGWLLFLLLRQLFRCTENVEHKRSVQPERGGTESVETDHSETVERDRTENMEREQTETVEREHTGNEDRMHTESLEREHTRNEDRDHTESVGREHTETKETDHTETKETDHTETVNREHTGEHTETLERDHEESVQRNRTESVDVRDMLEKAPGGVAARDLFNYLQDPMNDPEVRTDEIDRRATVQHVKLLRNRLEATTREEVDQLKKTCRRIVAQNDETKRKLGEIFDVMRQLSSQLNKVAMSRRSVSA